jgi:alpha-L-glutamate ligase-like protein
MIVGLAKRLRAAGVLGINRRNADFTLRYNPRSRYPLVDDKLRTKALAQAAGIAVPELYAVIEIERQVRDLEALVAGHSDFVIKPARGSGGDGVVVVTGRSKGLFRKASGSLVTGSDLKHHVSNVLSGMYSLSGQPDKAIIEYRVRFDPIFESIAYQGVPDVRIIVFLGVPVMSMVRLPTRRSDGKANLHQGAIGTGVDIATGRTLTAVWGNEIVADHPDTGNPVTGVQIPYWDRLLDLAARCYELTGLGYQGVDIVLDRDKGPLMLELNARPGLQIQIANRAGLLSRLELVEKSQSALVDAEARLAFARQHFCAAEILPAS